MAAFQNDAFLYGRASVSTTASSLSGLTSQRTLDSSNQTSPCQSYHNSPFAGPQSNFSQCSEDNFAPFDQPELPFQNLPTPYVEESLYSGFTNPIFMADVKIPSHGIDSHSGSTRLESPRARMPDRLPSLLRQQIVAKKRANLGVGSRAAANRQKYATYICPPRGVQSTPAIPRLRTPFLSTALLKALSNQYSQCDTYDDCLKHLLRDYISHKCPSLELPSSEQGLSMISLQDFEAVLASLNIMTVSEEHRPPSASSETSEAESDHIDLEEVQQRNNDNESDQEMEDQDHAVSGLQHGHDFVSTPVSGTDFFEKDARLLSTNPDPREAGPITEEAKNTESKRLFACPFYKRDPNKHRTHSACAGGWDTVHRTKEHVYRVHLLRNLCRRCKQAFDDDAALQNHSNSPVPCDIRMTGGEGCSPDQHMQLKRKKGKAESDVEAWTAMFVILFGVDAPMPSPFYRSCCETALEDYNKVLVSDLSKQIHNEMGRFSIRKKSRIKEIVQNQTDRLKYTFWTQSLRLQSISHNPQARSKAMRYEYLTPAMPLAMEVDQGLSLRGSPTKLPTRKRSRVGGAP